MTLTLTTVAWRELREQALKNTAYSPVQEPFVRHCTVPDQLGQGSYQFVDLYPDACLEIGHCTYHDELQVKHLEAEHPLQFSFKLAGECLHSNGKQNNLNYTMISGGGIQQELTSKIAPDTLTVGLEIFLSLDRLAMLFPDDSGQLCADLSFLAKHNDWQTLIYPKSNPAIQRTVQEIVNCPYQGLAKRLYLQGKVHDLIALQLASVLHDRGSVPPPIRLKPNTIAKIHQAKEILLANLEHPPALLDLAQQVGVSHTTLRRGFQDLFGTTVFGYLTQQRMIQAEQWLRAGQTTVAEVANQLGYAHFGCFAAAFKKQFGISPSECLAGKKQKS